MKRARRTGHGNDDGTGAGDECEAATLRRRSTTASRARSCARNSNGVANTTTAAAAVDDDSAEASARRRKRGRQQWAQRHAAPQQRRRAARDNDSDRGGDSSNDGDGERNEGSGERAQYSPPPTANQQGAADAADAAAPLDLASVDTFASMQLDARLAAAIARKMHWSAPSPVQSAVVPAALAGRDIVACAPTGSGKTGAYAIPIVHALLSSSSSSSSSSAAAAAAARQRGGDDSGSDRDSGETGTRDQYATHRRGGIGETLRVVVMVPTHELAAQVGAVFRALLRYAPDVRVKVARRTSVSSASTPALRASIVVGTPASLLAALNAHPAAAAAATTTTTTTTTTATSSTSMFASPSSSSSSSSSSFPPSYTSPTAATDTLTHFVIDEADLVLSFAARKHDVFTVARLVPRAAQGILVSATIDDDVRALRALALHQPQAVRINAEFDDAGGGGANDDGGNKPPPPPPPPQQQQHHLYTRLAHANEKYLVAYTAVRLAVVHGKAIFFVNDVASGFRLKLLFDRFQIRCAVLNAELPVNSRVHCIEQFNAGLFDYLIATDSAVQAKRAGAGGAGSRRDAENGAAASDERTAGAGADDTGDEFIASRGLDFQRVDTVINFDVPPTRDVYIHRAGRTARAGRAGAVLTLCTHVGDAYRQHNNNNNNDKDAAAADDDDERRLLQFFAPSPAAHAPNAHALPSAPQLLTFRAEQVNPFRYRVEDALHACGKYAVREARIHELKRELLNSARLRAHFAAHRADWAALKHDRALVASGANAASWSSSSSSSSSYSQSSLRAPAYLAHIPPYMLDEALQRAIAARGVRNDGVPVSSAAAAARAKKRQRRGGASAARAGGDAGGKRDGGDGRSDAPAAGARRRRQHERVRRRRRSDPLRKLKM